MTKVALDPRMWVAACVCGPKYASTGMLLHKQLGFHRHKKVKFSTIMLRFGMNPTSFGSHYKPHFFHSKKPYMVYFQRQRNPTRKIHDSLENSKSKGSFSQNTLKSILFYWTFSGPNPLSLMLLITFLLVCE